MLRFLTALAAVAICCAPARAEDRYAPASITFDQLQTKTRAASGSLAAGAYHSVTRETSLKGDVWTIESYWYEGDYRTTISQGSFVTAYGSFHGQEWSQDQNGLVTLSSDFASAHDPFVVAFAAAGPPSGVALLGMDSNSQDFVVEANPSAGLTQRRYYDASTYLLSRVEQVDYDGHKRTWDYSDYGNYEGRMVSRTVVHHIDGKERGRTQLERFERIAPAMARLSIPASRTLFDLGSRDQVEIPVKFTDNGVIVRVNIEGRGLDFALDSGASNIVLDPQVARTWDGVIRHRYGQFCR